jgi:uncharacterized membrane protein YdbT with pleckstrin-like domain
MNEKDFPVSAWWMLIGPVGRGKYKRTGQPPLYSFALMVILALVFMILVSINIVSSGQNLATFSFILFIPLAVFVFIGIFFTLPGVITNALRRKNFHFALEDNVLTIQDGIISKQQEQIPYSTIQDVQITQDFAHRLFSLASVVIENASRPQVGIGGEMMRAFTAKPSIGISDNQIIIPGLHKQDAENLKNALLQKMQGNHSVDTGAGL